MKIGVISDTHGLIRPEALRALDGSDLIVHAGDIGSPEVLEVLEGIAPVHAVRGNNDRDDWAIDVPETIVVLAGGFSIFVVHDVSDVYDVKTKSTHPSFDAGAYAAVISGHSHKPAIRREHGLLWLNPGSAGPRRFTLPVAVAVMTVRDGRVDARIIEMNEHDVPRRA